MTRLQKERCNVWEYQDKHCKREISKKHKKSGKCEEHYQELKCKCYGCSYCEYRKDDDGCKKNVAISNIKLYRCDGCENMTKNHMCQYENCRNRVLFLNVHNKGRCIIHKDLD